MSKMAIVVASAVAAAVVTAVMTYKVSKKAGQVMAAQDLTTAQLKHAEEIYAERQKEPFKGTLDELKVHRDGLFDQYTKEIDAIKKAYQDFLDSL